MKNHLIFFFCLIFLTISNALFAQPSNDNCSNAVPLTIASDKASAILVSGTTVNATGSTVPISVCSGNWYADDVWYSFTTDSTLPINGVTVKVIPYTLGLLGMAIYTDCDTNTLPLFCFSENGSLDSMNIPFLQSNTTYYIRMWSAGGATVNSGTFEIMVYENWVDPNQYIEVILWGNNTGEGDFSNGLNGWTSNAITTGDDWVWDAGAQANGTYRQTKIVSPTAMNGAALFDADFMTAVVNPTPTPPYPQHTAALFSPIIDCSNMPPLSVKFYQSYDALNGNCYFSYSIDSGQTFSTPINVNSDILENETTPQSSFKRYFLPNAGGSSHVQLKFTADIDFYNWIIDDVHLVEKEGNNLTLIEDFIAVAPNLMPFICIDTIRFLANVANIGLNDATNVVLSVDVVSNITGDTAFSATNYYGTIVAGDTIKNQLFTTSFLPTSIDEYTATYTLNSDSSDVFPLDNTYSFPFEVSHEIFRKAPPFVSGTRPYFPIDTNAFSFGTTFYADNDVLQWCEYIYNGAFSVANPYELAGETVEILIEKPATGNQFVVESDGQTILASNRIIVAEGSYTFSGMEPDNSMIEIHLSTPNVGNLYHLEPNMNYIVVVKYSPTSPLANDLKLNVSREIDYAATEVAASLSGVQRLSVVLDEGNSGNYNISGIGKDIIPAIYVRTTCLWIVTTTPHLTSNALNVFPNPADKFITANIALEEITPKMTLTIYRINGQIVETRNLSNIARENVLFDLTNYESGTYFMMLETAEGHILKQFVVTK